MLSGCLVLLLSVTFTTVAEASNVAGQSHKEQAELAKKNALAQPKLVGPTTKKKIYDTLLPYFTKNYIEAFITENFWETEKGLIKK
ncbi:DUF3993 domain-containing protein [Aneurinibacillus aneurinilyticus]|nr:DUF3993 domain-containing protein [Aneurinibacillus aneurinilyticus]MCI1695034.1 DUF3993 domain-containing protein [Aneurinibacillus aneurinilyticus]MED0706655.1 DUF3993 domain-containing protein [Aneurinibacillus aneurinilyticus]MED0723582.1 DUF3993 domain-containing protein [Aneurinibacillus aneurinilyticus]MED0731704.1 DUF3993 domain-containing protein [Aneurinibacillus aneurinilyticus]MED0742016.1 DUF3993 domain-containing protein [Aneurinibacillus aneurinilyticus]